MHYKSCVGHNDVDRVSTFWLSSELPGTLLVCISTLTSFCENTTHKSQRTAHVNERDQSGFVIEAVTFWKFKTIFYYEQRESFLSAYLRFAD
jgi:hypothetical protein